MPIKNILGGPSPPPPALCKFWAEKAYVELGEIFGGGFAVMWGEKLLLILMGSDYPHLCVQKLSMVLILVKIMD